MTHANFRKIGEKMGQKSICIVGGGYIGVELAKALEGVADVTLIEPKAAFVHAPAMLRALVDEQVRDKAIIPYDKLMNKGRLVAQRATLIKPDAVVVEDGSEIAADYIVLCPGASNGGIFKPGHEDIDSFRAAQSSAQTQIESAKSIVIVGAGAVGVELAGEIANAHPQKALTLISADSALFPTFPATLGAKLRSKLQALGVTVVLGSRVSDLVSTTAPYEGGVTLDNGERIDADLVIPAIGSKPQTALFDDLPDVVKTTDGRVKVDAYLRPSSLPNVFAAGDAVDAGDAMTIVAASRQQPWLAKMLKAVINGKSAESVKAYAPWGKAPILVPLGPARGNSYLVVGTFGDWATKTMKGNDLFISKYRKILGYT
ncbi:MAG: FAD-dependent oxidoreductase [Pseudomonadota bacterium]